MEKDIDFILSDESGIPEKLPDDTILYSSKHKALIISKTMTVKTLQCAIRYLRSEAEFHGKMIVPKRE